MEGGIARCSGDRSHDREFTSILQVELADKMVWKSFCSGRLLLQNDSQVAVIGAKTTDILHFVIFLYFSILIGLCQR
jgi:hypothetical protein